MAFSLVVTREQRTLDRLEVHEDKPSFVIGRGDDSDVRLESTNVSRRHCELVSRGGYQVVRDLGSSNGTFVNGRKVKEHALNPGDVITVGEFSVRYDVSREATVAAPQPTGGVDLTVRINTKPHGSGPAATTAAARATARAPAHVQVLSPGEPRTVIMRGAMLLVGASAAADVHLTGARAPAIAAAFLRDGDAVVVVDLSPRRDALRVAGARTHQAVLPAESELEVAGLRLRFRRGLPKGDPSLASRPTGRVPRP